MPPSTRIKAVREEISASRAPAQTVINDKQQNEIGIRQRREPSDHESISNRSQSSRKSNAPDEPPRFVIDLSLPPEQRYLEVCSHFQDEMPGLTSLFDDVVAGFVRFIPLTWIHRISRLFLRRVYDGEENRELQGISQATSVPMYLLVCFNVLLDLFMGCSSGGAAVRDGEGGSKMVHFRTLDWGMDPLRRIVVQLDFRTESNEPIVASSITYAGYIGVLTGVRKSFSLSLNFRPNRHHRGKFWHDLKYNWHLLMVLLGWRRSISSELRRFLLPGSTSTKWWRSGNAKNREFWTYVDVVNQVSGKGRKPLTTTACYLCFSDGKETTVLEKDVATAVARSSDNFIVITNNDLDAEDEQRAGTRPEEKSEFAAALAEIVHEAQDRRQCAGHNYHSMRAQKARAAGVTNTEAAKIVLDVDDIVGMVQLYPTLNETSHFACVMDATEGTVRWCRRWWRPITAKWIREHRSVHGK